jgi:general secretion pathway protein D
VLRLKNGETQILAGLILDDERKSASKLPGIGDIPLLGRLFANQEDRKSKTEIVLAITPRIIGNINLPQAEVSEYWSGTEAVITDKPQVNLPPAVLPKTAQEQMREQMRLRQLNANPEVAPALPTAEQVTPAAEASANNPAAEPPTVQQEPIQQPAETQPLESQPIPTFDPSNPPLAP